jgi:uncharacterized damage-inducible protein DinB
MTCVIDNSRIRIEVLCSLVDEAFDNGRPTSLLSNLVNLREEDWTALPANGGRSIADILEHVGWAKWMYENYAFGDGAMRGDQPPLVPSNGLKSRAHDELIAWLRQGHQKWLTSIRALDDDRELDRERLSNWGEMLPTRTLIHIMISHDYYHAGEINHLRALLQADDHWDY